MSGPQEEAWVIRKRGLFYRPNANGYTSNVLEAGVWNHAAAKRHESPDDGVSIHRRSEWPVAVDARDAEDAIRWLRGRADSLSKHIKLGEFGLYGASDARLDRHVADLLERLSAHNIAGEALQTTQPKTRAGAR